MEDKDKLTIATSLRKCEDLVKANLELVGQESEAELRSIQNEQLAVELMKFGEFVADVAHMKQTHKDFLDQMFEHKKQEKTDMPVNKAESEVKTDLEYMAELLKLRELEKAENVLKRKEKSLYAILDQSRSRYSLVNKDRIGGN